MKKDCMNACPNETWDMDFTLIFSSHRKNKQTNKQATLPFLFADMRGQKGLANMHIGPSPIQF